MKYRGFKIEKLADRLYQVILPGPYGPKACKFPDVEFCKLAIDYHIKMHS